MIPPLNLALRPAVALRIGAAICAAMVLGAGCATSPSRRGGIESLHVFSTPVALNLGGSSGPDGFGVTLYASTAAEAKGVPLTAGRMEILMFEGALQGDGTTNAAPRRVWTFTTADLKNHVIKTSLGTGYRLILRWNETPPRQNRITIVARYVHARETAIQSAPTTIAVTAATGARLNGTAITLPLTARALSALVPQ